MKHYGWEPPWEGSSEHLGGWKKGEEMWDGSGYVWTWSKWAGGRGASLTAITSILKNFYLKPLQEEMNNNIFLETLAEEREERGYSEPKRDSFIWKLMPSWLRGEL